MDKIRIGNGPDFCMMRGKELLNYKAKISVLGDTKEANIALITDRSFAMVFKTVIQYVSSFSTCNKIEFETLKGQNVLAALFCCENKSKFAIKLYLPRELDKVQLDDINKEFKKHTQNLLKRHRGTPSS